MKKSIIIAGLATLLAVNANALDFGGLKKAANAKDEAKEKVDDAKTQVDETSAAAKDATSSPDQLALALVKAKFKTGSTKAKIRKDLGEPDSVSGKKDAESWFYEVSEINESLADKAEMASMVGIDIPGADKQIEIQFTSDKIHAVKIAE